MFFCGTKRNFLWRRDIWEFWKQVKLEFYHECFCKKCAGQKVDFPVFKESSLVYTFYLGLYSSDYTEHFYILYLTQLDLNL